jgi:hypothetical protein
MAISNLEARLYTIRTVTNFMRLVAPLQEKMPPWARISGRKTPGLTRVHPPHLLYKGGWVNPGLNPGGLASLDLGSGLNIGVQFI